MGSPSVGGALAAETQRQTLVPFAAADLGIRLGVARLMRSTSITGARYCAWFDREAAAFGVVVRGRDLRHRNNRSRVDHRRGRSGHRGSSVIGALHRRAIRLLRWQRAVRAMTHRLAFVTERLVRRRPTGEACRSQAQQPQHRTTKDNTANQIRTHGTPREKRVIPIVGRSEGHRTLDQFFFQLLREKIGEVGICLSCNSNPRTLNQK
jgi:hypothetical protein